MLPALLLLAAPAHDPPQRRSVLAVPLFGTAKEPPPRDQPLPAEPPEELRDRYTMNGSVTLEHWLIDDRGAGECWTVDGNCAWKDVECTAEELQRCADPATSKLWTRQWVDRWIAASRKGKQDFGGYGNRTTSFLREALAAQADTIAGRHFVVVGSQKARAPPPTPPHPRRVPTHPRLLSRRLTSTAPLHPRAALV